MKIMQAAVFAALAFIDLSVLADEQAMKPGLWSMQLQGTVHIAMPAMDQPLHSQRQVCVKAGQSNVESFLPAHHVQCQSTHSPAGAGKENWHIQCQMPQATVTQTGWIESLGQTLRAHWLMTMTTSGPMTYSTQTTLDMQGQWQSADCGSVH